MCIVKFTNKQTKIDLSHKNSEEDQIKSISTLHTYIFIVNILISTTPATQ